MQRELELMNLKSEKSLVRHIFDESSEKRIIDLSTASISEVDIPSNFNDKSFFPKQSLDLNSVSEILSIDLKKLGANSDYIKKTIPGVCEAIKNAYEHGNLENGSKKITFAQLLSNKKVEFLVGDEGLTINSSFLPYVLLMRQKDVGKFYENVPNFYSFCGDLFAPKGHSGIGTKTMNLCFNKVHYYRKKDEGLLVHLEKPFDLSQ